MGLLAAPPARLPAVPLAAARQARLPGLHAGWHAAPAHATQPSQRGGRQGSQGFAVTAAGRRGGSGGGGGGKRKAKKPKIECVVGWSSSIVALTESASMQPATAWRPARCHRCSPPPLLTLHSRAAAATPAARSEAAAFEQLMRDWDDAFAADCEDADKAALVAGLSQQGYAQQGRGARSHAWVGGWLGGLMHCDRCCRCTECAEQRPSLQGQSHGCRQRTECAAAAAPACPLPCRLCTRASPNAWSTPCPIPQALCLCEAGWRRAAAAAARRQPARALARRRRQQRRVSGGGQGGGACACVG